MPIVDSYITRKQVPDCNATLTPATIVRVKTRLGLGRASLTSQRNEIQWLKEGGCRVAVHSAVFSLPTDALRVSVGKLMTC